MSSRKFRRIAMLVLVVSSFGIFTLRPAAAASRRNGPLLPGGVSLHTFMANIMDAFGAVFAPKWNPGPPPGPDPGNQPPPGSLPKEGSGMCPNGGGPRPGPGQ